MATRKAAAKVAEQDAARVERDAEAAVAQARRERLARAYAYLLERRLKRLGAQDDPQGANSREPERAPLVDEIGVA